MADKIDPTKMTPATLALVLSNASQRQITEEQVRIVAESGELLMENDTINLIRYTAFLAQATDEKNHD